MLVIPLKVYNTLFLMCGIIVRFGNSLHYKSRPLKHRGPDDYRIEIVGKCRMDFTRLSINDTTDLGAQPFIRNNVALVCNGEIYNHKELETGKEVSGSDCECLIKLVDRYGMYDACNMIRGVFAMAWTDGDRLLAARDPIGVRPLFYSRDTDNITFASEMKALDGRVEIFPPGHFYDSLLDDFVCYNKLYWMPQASNVEAIKDTFIQAVRRRVFNTDRKIGFFLSGGLDSSLVVSVAKNILGRDKIRTFSIGQEDSPDTTAARRLADYLGIEHTNVPFDFDEGIKAIPNVIQAIESYDTTTVRASTPMWLLCKWIKENTDCRVILSGEGSDELFGGYKYFKLSPGEQEFHMETVRRVRLLHQFDVLRADRCTAAHGLELRVPFLDIDFVNLVMEIDPSLKRTKDEKKILRDAFEGYLPEHILRRPKDAFSDAVGYGWVDHTHSHAEKVLSDIKFETIQMQADNHNIPTTKEEALYRHLFWKFYGSRNDHTISEIWRPRWTSVTDPSARKI